MTLNKKMITNCELLNPERVKNFTLVTSQEKKTRYAANKR